MEDQEIYLYGSDILRTITDDLNEGIYSELQGRLTLALVETKEFNAWADSEGVMGEPPQHKVSISYEMVLRIYRDAEEFCDFIRTDINNSVYKDLLDFFGDGPLLPECFSAKNCVNNMFIAALTWVYFHEVGHLIQEHGYIRDPGRYTSGSGVMIHECQADSDEVLTGREAAISHVTELAADFEATFLCLAELMFHFAFDEHGNELPPEGFMGASYLFVCGMSCVFYRFNRGRGLEPSACPVGSHPPPIDRLELNLPHIFEWFDILAINAFTKLDRRAIVMLLSKAAYSGAIFWACKKSNNPVIPERALIKGIMNKPESKDYYRVIVETWDEIEPTIRACRRTQSEYSLLGFSDQFRAYVAR